MAKKRRMRKTGQLGAPAAETVEEGVIEQDSSPKPAKKTIKKKKTFFSRDKD